MTSDDSGVNGLLLVDKPGLAFPALDAPMPGPRAFPTSHDVVQQVRRAAKERRIGHTGTLDPMASGLLILCLGRATRLVEYYQGHAKRYLAEVTLGYATDTYDALGAITATMPVPALDDERIERAIASLRGPQLQTPPVYSALKQGGESIHYKARRGEDVKVEPRAVDFYEITVLAFDAPNRLTLAIHCSAGAYIRSLAYDLGRELGTLGTLTGLRRTAAGPFNVDEAHTLDAISAAAATEGLDALLLPPGARLDLPIVSAPDDVVARLGYGQIVAAADLHLLQPAPDAEVAQVRAADDRLLGIIRRITPPAATAAPAGWRAEKWFA